MSDGELVPCPNCGETVYKWISSANQVCWYEPFGRGKENSYGGKYPNEPSRKGHDCSRWTSHHCCTCLDHE